MATAEADPEVHTNLMQAVVLEQYGDEENLKIESIPWPKITADQVLIRVQAASVNPIDWKIRQGMLKWIIPAQLPATLGFDVAGEIAEVGYSAKQQGWNVGDQVMAFSDQALGGGYAEYIAVDSKVIVAKPGGCSFEEAAAIPLAATTAWKALVKLGQLHAGDDVLINGASGGVGTYAVQIAKALGANVTAVCSLDNHQLVRELGADDTIDYHATQFTRVGRTFDIVFDAVSKSSFHECRRILKPQGHYIATLPSVESVGMSMISRFQKQSCHVVLARPDGDILKSLTALANEGKLRTVLDTVFPLNEVAAAHRKSEGGHVVGKIVLHVSNEMPDEKSQPEQ
ncbi:NAD(P)-dependent alcohol dehydrogenase [Bremerella sp. P1]|uniref:NAD(P)-dependent alcohol dehydrogenase n=1 Tax=Bremerella sp. P1 TaxID=3026424 RepID=UPI0023678996|nr:NAD(P)-dependent alcohol dehydrogenase [Bremerella sp. P1]WDI40975.1 NAD(P)-dependent alcohol dehydrogenase [Bremerella sp. P1]